MLPNGVTQASYTQWEYFLARHYDRECLLFLAQDAYDPDEASAPAANSACSLSIAAFSSMRPCGIPTFPID